MEEILEECKRKYPVGTEFHSIRNGNTGQIFTVNNNVLIKWNATEIIVNHSTGPTIYKDGKWSKIVSLPQPQELQYEIC